MEKILNISTRAELLIHAINSIFSLAGIQEDCLEINRWIIQDGKLISWPFFEWFHSQKEDEWVSGERVYHIVLQSWKEIIVSYRKLELQGYTSISIFTLKNIPGVWDILYQIKQIENSIRSQEWIPKTAWDRVHELI